jgi:serine protease inhibitor
VAGRTSNRPSIGVLCLLVAVASCSGDGGDAGHALGPARPGPITELPSDLTQSERIAIAASNGFGLELAARVSTADSRVNAVLSPLSASMALGMTLNGANGTTFDAMRSALGLGSLTREQINEAYRDLIDLLEGLDPDVRFEIANAIWANRNVPFSDAFVQTVDAAFDARAESTDFGDPSTLAAINAWVKEHTGGHIDSIVDSLDPALVVLLVNAIYFDGKWTTQFDPDDTRRRAFTREDGSTVDVDMMSIRDIELPRASGPSYAAVELPYGGEAYSMVIVLPDAGTSARDWVANLDGGAWAALTNALTPGELDLLSIPKFTLTYDTYLNDALEAMGMDPAFSPGADFTRMSPVGDQICIDFVRQKTYIDVDERGTRAAAATGAGLGVTSFTAFEADRPFVFAIRERLSGTLLFVGYVGDPTARDPGPEPLVSDCTGTVQP